MTFEFSSVVAVGIIGALVCVVLKQYKPEFAAPAAICTGLIILLIVIPQFSSALEYITKITQMGEIGSTYSITIAKALGICIISQLASDTCKDCGQSSLASKVELGGKISVLLISIPMFASLIETVNKLINM